MAPTKKHKKKKHTRKSSRYKKGPTRKSSRQKKSTPKGKQYIDERPTKRAKVAGSSPSPLQRIKSIYGYNNQHGTQKVVNNFYIDALKTKLEHMKKKYMWIKKNFENKDEIKENTFNDIILKRINEDYDKILELQKSTIEGSINNDNKKYLYYLMSDKPAEPAKQGDKQDLINELRGDKTINDAKDLLEWDVLNHDEQLYFLKDIGLGNDKQLEQFKKKINSVKDLLRNKAEVKIDLFEVFKENTFGPGTPYDKLYEYYTAYATLYYAPGTQVDPKLINFLLLRDQVRWYVIYRQRFICDTIHDFIGKRATGDREIPAEYFHDLIDKYRLEIKNLIIILISKHGNIIQEILDDNLNFSFNGNANIRLFTNNTNDLTNMNDIDVMYKKDIKQSELKSDFEEPFYKLLSGTSKDAFETIDTQDKIQNHLRSLVNEAGIQFLPLPEKLRTIDFLIYLNQGGVLEPGEDGRSLTKDFMKTVNILGVDSVGDYAKYTDIMKLIDETETQSGDTIGALSYLWYLKSIAGTYDSGGDRFNYKNSNKKQRNGDRNIDLSNYNIKFNEFFNFRKFNFQSGQIENIHKHNLLSYELVNVSGNKPKAKLILKHFSVYDTTGDASGQSLPFSTEDSTLGHNKNEILLFPTTYPNAPDTFLYNESIKYFMAKLLGDESKINVTYAFQNRLAFKDERKSINEYYYRSGSSQEVEPPLYYSVSGDIASSTGAGFKLPGSVVVELKKDVEIINPDGTEITAGDGIQKWPVRSWVYYNPLFKKLFQLPPLAERRLMVIPIDADVVVPMSSAFGKRRPKGRFIQKANKESQRKGTKGSFTRWCRSKGLANRDGKVTKRCIANALKSKSLVTRRRAQFAKNIHAIAKSTRKTRGSSFGLHRPKKNRSGKRFIQDVFRRSERKGTSGSFTRWCKRHHLLGVNGKINKRCINAGLKARSKTIRRRAQFLKNVLYRRTQKVVKHVKRSGKTAFGKKVSRKTVSRKQNTGRKPVPVNKKLYASVLKYVKARAKVWPSAYASGQVVKRYKRMGGKYRFLKK